MRHAELPRERARDPAAIARVRRVRRARCGGRRSGRRAVPWPLGIVLQRTAHRRSSRASPTLSAHARHERECGGEATGAAVPERAHQPAVALAARASSPGAKFERAGAHARRSHAGRRRGRRTAPHAEWEDTPLPITSSPPGRQGTPATRPRQSRAKRIVVMPATRPRQCPVPPGFFFAAFLAGLAAHRASGKRIPGSSFFVGSGTCRRKEERLPRLLRIPSDFRRFRAAKPRGCFQVAGLFPRSPARSCQKQCLQKGSPCTTSKIPRWSG